MILRLTKAQAEAAVNAFQDVFVEAMQSGEGLKLTGLFSAERVKRAAPQLKRCRGACLWGHALHRYGQAVRPVFEKKRVVINR